MSKLKRLARSNGNLLLAGLRPQPATCSSDESAVHWISQSLLSRWEWLVSCLRSLNNAPLLITTWCDEKSSPADSTAAPASTLLGALLGAATTTWPICTCRDPLPALPTGLAANELLPFIRTFFGAVFMLLGCLPTTASLLPVGVPGLTASATSLCNATSLCRLWWPTGRCWARASPTCTA